MLSKDQTLGKYQILDRLGSGGFGAVYLALDTWVNRKVALKVPHQQQDEIVDMLKEPRIMAGLKHPNIVELITVERKNGIFFMVLEYVEGESLDRMIRRERTLPPTRAGAPWSSTMCTWGATCSQWSAWRSRPTSSPCWALRTASMPCAWSTPICA